MRRYPRTLTDPATLVRVVAVMGVIAAAAVHASAPPDPPTVRGIEQERAAPAIFTYRVDERCRVTAPRKLQGPEPLEWREVERALDLAAERTVWRMVDGDRRQFLERRVTLSGEMVEGGELYCLMTPMGQVFDAWIMRTNPSAPRQQRPQRQTAPVSDGTLGDLGTFSILFYFSDAP
jgi:hypothetical protein